MKEVADWFNERSKMTFRRFSLDNYVQTELAWGLVLIALGKHDQGQQRLAAFCENFAIAPDAAILLQARKQAASIANGA
ncbi:hypothetical protein RB623_20970 [Mesorhizobium sp. LHD-90]|uniref:hypothetical protein n=1 Tax=Mesorhizobium sp. LHD-90 TaxID=3071414 RepID=UPI0027E058BD|nr:hypothetical protein [Mesorhizobium sp. LHD-90]MDQ6436530.1 hypothetical protein [Mesorhizobium sp. LHD-90]